MNYPAIQLLAQGYLTIDWPDDYADAWAAVDDYLANEPIAVQLPEEVVRLLEAVPSEDAIRTFLVGKLGSGYLPEADGFTMRAWLLAVRQRVLEAL